MRFRLLNLFLLTGLLVATGRLLRNSPGAAILESSSNAASILRHLPKCGEERITKLITISKSDKAITTRPFYFNFIPIHRQEWKKFLSLSTMMFWIVFVFSMTRDTKDTLIVTNCGAEAIAFLKVYGVIPGTHLLHQSPVLRVSLNNTTTFSIVTKLYCTYYSNYY